MRIFNSGKNRVLTIRKSTKNVGKNTLLTPVVNKMLRYEILT